MNAIRKIGQRLSKISVGGKKKSDKQKGNANQTSASSPKDVQNGVNVSCGRGVLTSDFNNSFVSPVSSSSKHKSAKRDNPAIDNESVDVSSLGSFDNPFRENYGAGQGLRGQASIGKTNSGVLKVENNGGRGNKTTKDDRLEMDASSQWERSVSFVPPNDKDNTKSEHSNRIYGKQDQVKHQLSFMIAVEPKDSGSAKHYKTATKNDSKRGFYGDLLFPRSVPSRTGEVPRTMSNKEFEHGVNTGTFHKQTKDVNKIETCLNLDSSRLRIPSTGNAARKEKPGVSRGNSDQPKRDAFHFDSMESLLTTMSLQDLSIGSSDTTLNEAETTRAHTKSIRRQSSSLTDIDRYDRYFCFLSSRQGGDKSPHVALDVLHTTLKSPAAMDTSANADRTTGTQRQTPIGDARTQRVTALMSPRPFEQPRTSQQKTMPPRLSTMTAKSAPKVNSNVSGSTKCFSAGQCRTFSEQHAVVSSVLSAPRTANVVPQKESGIFGKSGCFPKDDTDGWRLTSIKEPRIVQDDFQRSRGNSRTSTPLGFNPAATTLFGFDEKSYVASRPGRTREIGLGFTPARPTQHPHTVGLRASSPDERGKLSKQFRVAEPPILAERVEKSKQQVDVPGQASNQVHQRRASPEVIMSKGESPEPGDWYTKPSGIKSPEDTRSYSKSYYRPNSVTEGVASRYHDVVLDLQETLQNLNFCPISTKEILQQSKKGWGGKRHPDLV